MEVEKCRFFDVFVVDWKKMCIFATDMDTENKIHEIDVWIDDFTPCLKDNLTGEVVNTEVVRIRRKSFLSKFNRKSG